MLLGHARLSRSFVLSHEVHRPPAKFRKMGFIDYQGESPITIDNSLLSVVLHD
jgi:hypothetical protein